MILGKEVKMVINQFIEIFSKKDQLPSDDILLQEINKALEYVQSSASLYYAINIDELPY